MKDPHTYLSASIRGDAKRLPELWPTLARLTAMAGSALGIENLHLHREFEKPLTSVEITERMRVERKILSEGMGTSE